MKILLHIYGIGGFEKGLRLNHQVMTIGLEGTASLDGFPYDVSYSENDSFRQIADKLPPHFVPDIFMAACEPMYSFPAGVEMLPWPTVLLVSDWMYDFDAISRLAPFFDAIVTCSSDGPEYFKALGCKNSFYFPWAGMPEVSDHGGGGDEKLYDVAFVGNLNPVVQRERGFWLERLAAMGDKFRVYIDGGGVDWRKVYSKAKIVFNWGWPHCVNFRVHQAMSYDALQINRRDHSEIANFYKDSEEIVLVGPDDFEEVIERYLNDDAERRRIALNGHKKAVENYSYEKRCQALLNFLSEQFAKDGLRGRLFRGGPQEGFRESVMDWAAFLTYQLRPVSAQKAASLYMELASDGFNEPALFNNMAVALLKSGRADDARLSFCAALETNPHYALAILNYGSFLFRAAELKSAEMLLTKGYHLLKSGSYDKSCLAGLPLYLSWDRFKLDWEKALYCGALHGEEVFISSAASNLRFRACHELGMIKIAQGSFEEAQAYFELALKEKPDDGYVTSLIGSSLHAQGRIGGAIEFFRAALAKEPFFAEAQYRLAGLLFRIGRCEEAFDIANRSLKMPPKLNPYRNRILDIIARCQIELGDYEGAAKSYKEAMAAAPS